MYALNVDLKSAIADALDRDARELGQIAQSLRGNTPANPPPKAATSVADLGVRFVTAAEGVVLDRNTGLEWTRGNVIAQRVEWAAANEACEKLSLAGGGWRMPTIQELRELVDYERHDPAIDPIFTCESSWYWTSTPAAPSPGDCAWLVYFYDGYAGWDGRNYSGFVRAVRASQS